MPEPEESILFGPAPVNGEPWCNLPAGPELGGWGREEEVAYNQQMRQTEKHRFFCLAFDFIKCNGITGDYLEFGCHRCRTFRMALTEARRQNLSDMRFWAFDSFEGLPQAGKAHGVSQWKPGALGTGEAEFLNLVRAHGLFVDAVHIVKGFYDKTLTPELQERLRAQKMKAAFVCVDCDLYESALPVFAFLDPFLQPGTVLYVDDLFAGYQGSPYEGVGRAFLEYQEKSRWKFAPHLSVGWWGRSYVVCAPDTPAVKGI